MGDSREGCARVMAETFDATTQAMIAANEANWDARTPIHLESQFYGVRQGRPAEFWFADYEWADLGELAGRDVLHLQCHLGTETLAFARRGARTVGLDISARSVDAARDVARRSGVDIEYVRADVFAAREALGGRRFDVVYTGKGALCYLPDLDRWTRLVFDLLRGGGILYIVEFHPVLQALGTSPDGPTEDLLIRRDYLEGRGGVFHEIARTYTDGPPLPGATDSYEWSHGLGELITAAVGAGFRVESLRESEVSPYPRWSRMDRTPDGWWRLPPDEPRVPLFYALRLRRPETSPS